MNTASHFLNDRLSRICLSSVCFAIEAIDGTLCQLHHSNCPLLELLFEVR